MVFTSTKQQNFKHLIIQFQFVMYALSVLFSNDEQKKCLKRSSREPNQTNMLFFSLFSVPAHNLAAKPQNADWHLRGLYSFGIPRNINVQTHTHAYTSINVENECVPWDSNVCS